MTPARGICDDVENESLLQAYMQLHQQHSSARQVLPPLSRYTTRLVMQKISSSLRGVNQRGFGMDPSSSATSAMLARTCSALCKWRFLLRSGWIDAYITSLVSKNSLSTAAWAVLVLWPKVSIVGVFKGCVRNVLVRCLRVNKLRHRHQL